MTEEWLTTKQVAEMVGTSVANIHYFRSQGRGPKAKKLGRRLLFNRTDVEQWLADLPEAKSQTERRPLNEEQLQLLAAVLIKSQRERESKSR